MKDTATVPRTPGDREPVSPPVVDPELADQLLARAEAGGVKLLAPDGLLSRVTKAVLERALAEEMTGHLRYEKHDPAGRGSGNSRNGTTPKAVLTDVGAARRSGLIRRENIMMIITSEAVSRRCRSRLTAGIAAVVSGWGSGGTSAGRAWPSEAAGSWLVSGPDRHRRPGTGGRAGHRGCDDAGGVISAGGPVDVAVQVCAGPR